MPSTATSTQPVVVNFSHPLTAGQLARLEALTGQPLDRVIDVPAHFDQGAAFAPQIVALVEAAGLTALDWQTLPLLIVPPALNYIAVILLAELHGRMGYFPACIRLRPVPDAVPPRYEVAEILPLQAFRDAARQRR